MAPMSTQERNRWFWERQEQCVQGAACGVSPCFLCSKSPSVFPAHKHKKRISPFQTLLLLLLLLLPQSSLSMSPGWLVFYCIFLFSADGAQSSPVTTSYFRFMLRCGASTRETAVGTHTALCCRPRWAAVKYVSALAHRYSFTLYCSLLPSQAYRESVCLLPLGGGCLK